MPKEIFLEIINKHLYLPLALILFVYFIYNFVLIKLALRFNNVDIKLKYLFPFILSCNIFQLAGSQFFPSPIFGFIVIIFFTLILHFLGKIGFVKALCSSFFVVFLSVLSVVIVFQPLALYNKSFMQSFVKTPLGIAVGTLFEMALPAAVLISFLLFRIHIPYSKNKTSKHDIFFALIFAMMFFPVYYLAILFLWIYKNIPDSSLIIVLVVEITLFVFAGLIFLYFTKSEHKKQLDKTQLQTQLDQSYRLIETLFSERREYRNQLQVMNLMATATNNKEIGDYIFQIIENMAIASIGNIKNPIIASAIVSRQVQAKEKGVTIVLQCDTQLNELASYSLRLGEIFETLLDLFIENELISKNPTQMIFLYMNENKDEYFLEFKSSEATISTFKNTPNKPPLKLLPDPLGETAKVEHILELIREIGGEPTYVTQGNRLVRLKFTIKKPRHK